MIRAHRGGAAITTSSGPVSTCAASARRALVGGDRGAPGRTTMTTDTAIRDGSVASAKRCPPDDPRDGVNEMFVITPGAAVPFTDNSLRTSPSESAARASRQASIGAFEDTNRPSTPSSICSGILPTADATRWRSQQVRQDHDRALRREPVRHNGRGRSRRPCRRARRARGTGRGCGGRCPMAERRRRRR